MATETDQEKAGIDFGDLLIGVAIGGALMFFAGRRRSSVLYFDNDDDDKDDEPESLSTKLLALAGEVEARSRAKERT